MYSVIKLIVKSEKKKRILTSSITLSNVIEELITIDKNTIIIYNYIISGLDSKCAFYPISKFSVSKTELCKDWLLRNRILARKPRSCHGKSAGIELRFLQVTKNWKRFPFPLCLCLASLILILLTKSRFMWSLFIINVKISDLFR